MSARRSPIRPFRTMPARIVRTALPQDRRILAVSDVHGNLPYLRGLLEKTRFCPDDVLVLVGDLLEDSLRSHSIDLTANPATRTPLTFANQKTPRTLTGGEAASVHFEYSAYYTYDFTFENYRYTRAINGNTMTDDGGAPCTYANVILLYVDMVSRNDSSGHQDLLLENGGSGLYFNGGRYENIRWEKGGGEAPLRLLDENGNDLVLNPGQSYIGFVRSTQAGKTVY